MNPLIQTLTESSRQVIKDCSMDNGAIVAANSTKDYFPKEAKNYFFVWPRDGAYNCIAANILGIKIQENFFRWCMRAEGWNETGLFYEKYFTCGKKAMHHFQPDQTGAILIALLDYYKDKTIPHDIKNLIVKSANGLCNLWNKDHFNHITQDLWEERLCFPDLNENFTYSLGSCCRGLLCADKLMPDKNWVKTANEMKETLMKNNKTYFSRSFGKLTDQRPDASLMGLVWPLNIINADDSKMKKTIALIEKKIVKNYGVYRYENDEYDGWMHRKHTHRKKGAGYWPLLNFWMSIYHIENKNKARALKYYNKVLDDLKDKKYIPEQIFDNDIQVSVSPLCWSHSMFVIASKKLGLV